MRKVVFLPFLFIFLLFSCAERQVRVPFSVLGEGAEALERVVESESGNAQLSVRLVRFPEGADVRGKSLAVELLYDGRVEAGADSFEIGLLRGADPSDDLRDVGSLSPLVSGRVSDSSPRSMRIRVELFAGGGEAPAGFFIRTTRTTGLSVPFMGIVAPRIGVDVSSGVPAFAFGAEGGEVRRGDSVSFRADPFGAGVPALVEARFRTGAAPDASAVLTIGGEKFTVRRAPDGSAARIPLAAADRAELSPVAVVSGGPDLASVMLVPDSGVEAKFSAGSRSVLTPIRIDPGLVMYWPKKNWRGEGYELFEWDRFPGVLLIDFADYAVQDDFMRRIAFFVEKAGYRGKLLSDSFLEGKHAYNAHDYRAESLAEFFEKARAENFPLGKRELLLKEILAENGVLKVAADGTVSAGRGAVISISQESPMSLRTQFVAHEGWHGIFFVDPEFREFVNGEFDAMDGGSRRYLVRYFQVTPSLNYDVRDGYLLRNEFMAYMLERPVRDIARYYVDKAGRRHSQDLAKAEADYVLSTDARGFTAASRRLSDYVRSRWNLEAGRVWLIN